MSEDFGFSDCMGPKLRRHVEDQLIADLRHYLHSDSGLERHHFSFDWSQSCIEGHRMEWLDGEVENFSAIRVLDGSGRLVAEGWMEFIETETGLEVFWWFLEGGNSYSVLSKKSNTVPSHIWDGLSQSVRSEWREFAPRTIGTDEHLPQ